MAIIVLTSAGGSPGVTTTALGLALNWPRQVLLADCDRHPGQAVLAGYLRGMSAGGRGLGAIAQSYRALEASGAERLLDQTLPLTDEQTTPRHFLPGFAHPAAAVLFDRYWPRLIAQFSELQQLQTDVIVDWGRLDSDGLPSQLIERARLVLVLTRSGLPALARLRLFLPEVSEARTQLVVVGGGRPYGAAEIAEQLDVPLAADLPWDPETAAVLSDGDPEPRKLASRPLWRGWQGLAMSTAAATEVVRS